MLNNNVLHSEWNCMRILFSSGCFILMQITLAYTINMHYFQLNARYYTCALCIRRWLLLCDTILRHSDGRYVLRGDRHEKLRTFSFVRFLRVKTIVFNKQRTKAIFFTLFWSKSIFFALFHFKHPQLLLLWPFPLHIFNFKNAFDLKMIFCVFFCLQKNYAHDWLSFII